jgi:hypothetical protein
MSILTLRFYYLMLTTVKLSIGKIYLDYYCNFLNFQNLLVINLIDGSDSSKQKLIVHCSRRLRLQQHRSDAQILRSLREAYNCQVSTSTSRWRPERCQTRPLTRLGGLPIVLSETSPFTQFISCH